MQWEPSGLSTDGPAATDASRLQRNRGGIGAAAGAGLVAAVVRHLMRRSHFPTGGHPKAAPTSTPSRGWKVTELGGPVG